MLAQRIFQQPARQVLAHQPAFARFALPAAIATNHLHIQSRTAAFAPSSTGSSNPTTTPASPQDAYSILAAQRLQRPVSPHLSIYRPQITWYGSALNRITGSLLSGGFYIFGAAYLVSPMVGWHLESASMAEWFGGFSAVSKALMKGAVSLPFTYHSWNGIRHLIWDSGREFSNKQVQITGWVCVGLTVVSSAVLALI